VVKQIIYFGTEGVLTSSSAQDKQKMIKKELYHKDTVYMQNAKNKTETNTT
jgi:hypothetical protein